MVGYPLRWCLDPSTDVFDLESVCTGCSIPVSWSLVWTPLFLHPSHGVFGRFDLAALLRLPHLKFLFV